MYTLLEYRQTSRAAERSGTVVMGPFGGAASC